MSDTLSRNFLRKSSKGQVFVIIGIVIAASLLLIKVNTNFGFKARETDMGPDLSENEIFRNLENEFEESYDAAIKKGGDHGTINKTLRNYSLFLKSRMGKFNAFYVFSTYDNSTLKVSAWNLLDRNLENVEISQNLTGGTESCGTVGEGENCFESWSSPGRNEAYRVNVTYRDSFYNRNLAKTYIGHTGDKGNYNAMFYRTEAEIAKTHMTHEERLESVPQAG